MPSADFQVMDHGTVVSFIPLSQFAKEFVRDFIRPEPWQMMGNALVVDHRPAQNLMESLEEEGFTFE